MNNTLQKNEFLFSDEKAALGALDCFGSQGDGVLKLRQVWYLRPFECTALYARITCVVLIANFSTAASARHVRLLEAAGVELLALWTGAEGRVGVEHTKMLVLLHEVGADEAARSIIRHIKRARGARAVELGDAVVDFGAQVGAHAAGAAFYSCRAAHTTPCLLVAVQVLLEAHVAGLCSTRHGVQLLLQFELKPNIFFLFHVAAAAAIPVSPFFGTT